MADTAQAGTTTENGPPPVPPPEGRGALIRRAGGAPGAYSLTEISGVARAFAASHYFAKDVRGAEQAFVKLLAGQEYGLTLLQSMTGIYIVEGLPSLSAVTIGGLIKRHPLYNYRIAEHTDEVCRIRFYERESADDRWDYSVVVDEAYNVSGPHFVYESTFTRQDAEKAGLAGGKNWQRYGRNMLFARALTNGARWSCADVFGGAIYTPDELDHERYAVDEAGGVVTLVGEPVVEVNQRPESVTEEDRAAAAPGIVAEPTPVVTAESPQDQGPVVSVAQVRLLHAKAAEAVLTDAEKRRVTAAVAGTPHMDKVPRSRVTDLKRAFAELAGMEEAPRMARLNEYAAESRPPAAEEEPEPVEGELVDEGAAP